MKFRPKIKDMINENYMDPVLVIPKNKGLQENLKWTLERLGIDISNEGGMKAGRCKTGNIELLEYKGEDIPKIVEELYFYNNIKAIGFTGDDLFDEYRLRNQKSLLSILETVDWYDPKATFTRPALCLLSKYEERPYGKYSIAINEKYEMTSRQALEELAQEAPLDPIIRLYNGNTEMTVAQGINDYCIEIVYSGKTVKDLRLNIVDTIRFSDFVIIGVDESNPMVFKRDYEMIEDRKENPQEGSYSNRLLSNPEEAIAKVNEEYEEFDEEIRKENPDPKRIASEYADLNYTMNLAAVMKSTPFREIVRQMYKRQKKD